MIQGLKKKRKLFNENSIVIVLSQVYLRSYVMVTYFFFKKKKGLIHEVQF